MIVYSAGLLIQNIDITLQEGRNREDYVAFQVEVVMRHPAGVHLRGCLWELAQLLIGVY